MRSIVMLHYFLPVISTGVFFAVTQLLGVLLGNRSSTLRENNRIVTTTIPPGPSLSGYDGQFCASGKLMKSFANSKYSTVIEKTEGWGVDRHQALIPFSPHHQVSNIFISRNILLLSYLSATYTVLLPRSLVFIVMVSALVETWEKPVICVLLLAILGRCNKKRRAKEKYPSVI